MKERPILFSGPMVRAILNGSKTQTRRAYKVRKHPDMGCEIAASELVREPKAVIDRICPHGQPGGRLWVRESHAFVPEPAYRCSTGIYQQTNPCDSYQACVYRENFDRSRSFPWRPSIHMPRWASRITLEITGVRVERLNDISEADALAEGITYPQLPDNPDDNQQARTWYRGLWDTINGAGAWSSNPWVWVVEFQRVES